MLGVITLLVVAVAVGIKLWRRGQRSPWLALRSGDYGNAATYRAWRLEQEQIRDNYLGRYGRVYFQHE